MTTLAPAKVKETPAIALEKIAYASVSEIPTRESNDQCRMGYNVWQYLTGKKGSIQIAVRTSGARLLISEGEAVKIIAHHLKEAGIEA